MKKVSLLIAALAVACSARETTGTSDDPLITRTIVHLNSDGSIASQQFVQMTESQAQKDLARELAIRAGNIAVSPGGGSGVNAENSVLTDGTCASSSLHAWDHTDKSGHQLCIYADAMPACADLHNFCRGGCFFGNWSGNVKSYLTGNQPGGFYQSTTCGGTCSSGFNAGGENHAPADSCTQSAQSVDFFVNP